MTRLIYQAGGQARAKDALAMGVMALYLQEKLYAQDKLGRAPDLPPDAAGKDGAIKRDVGVNWQGCQQPRSHWRRIQGVGHG
jgi:hypothetical protein